MLELQNNQLLFSFPDVHPQAKLSIDFQRTLRIPDDEKAYPLPPSLGAFPLRHVDDFKDRVPSIWNEHGGVMLPMYQSEAMWIYFHTHYAPGHGVYPFAVKIAAGKVSAVTGDEWLGGLKEKDYVVAPQQRWLDGYAIGDGLIRQFVASPLGSGFTAEEQITGQARHGGIQIEVFPMKRASFERRFPYREPVQYSGGFRIGGSGMLGSYGLPGVYCSTNSANSSDIAFAGASASAETLTMGLAAGGKMKQQIFDDPYGLSDWDTDHGSRCFIHLANSMTWKAVTQSEPPYPPSTSDDYTKSGLPWFDYYKDDWKTLAGTGKLKGLKTLMQLGYQKGVQTLPENQPVYFRSDQIRVIGDKRPNEVRGGSW